jgi:CheY-like chemotaxis protein
MYPNVLLIDDDDDDQFIFLGALKEIAPDSRCHISNNALEAFQYLHAVAEVPDMLFLDLNMPMMNGFEFLLILKKDIRFSPIPVIIFSTSDNPEDLDRANELGALQFITKTADIQLLKKDLFDIFNTAPVLDSVIH